MDLTIEDARKIYDLLTNYSLTFEEFLERIRPDVSKYIGKVVVVMSYNSYYAPDWEENNMVDVETWDKLKNTDVDIYLGDIAGKHSNCTSSLSELVDEVITDPYEIYRKCRKEYVDDSSSNILHRAAEDM